MVIDAILGVGLLGAAVCGAMFVRQIVRATVAEQKLIGRLESDPEVRRIVLQVSTADSGGKLPPELAFDLREAIARHLEYLDPAERSEVNAGLLQDSLLGRRMYLAKFVDALRPRVLGQAARA